ncbi:helix-turn-helix transcriptional regulator [Numidum massiliense]|uniref:helix-turn-helix transcriptional regulator n=1 Tax=Numidum massiliense TaxID=1522315 RepID=UPI0006D55E87|nr:helix-turn-helix transcriptional regulator [Numidum massiliense]
MTVKNCVKEFRKQKGMTQEQLAEVVQVTRQTVIAIEKQRYEPYVGTALKLAKALDCPVEKLFWIEGEMSNGKR